MSAPGAVQAREPVPAAVQAMQQKALQDRRAYDMLRSLTEQVGTRFAGSEGDRKAVDWALTTLRNMGFARVRAEAVTVPRWQRGTVRVDVVGAEAVPLAAASLGGSVGTDGAPIEADVIAATTVAELERLSTSQVRGKIVFLYDRMLETRDGMDYGPTVKNRSSGAVAAARLGAVAVVIRAVGSEDEDRPHTGAMWYADGVPRIPAIAIGNRSADRLLHSYGHGPLRLRLTSTARCESTAQSANVIGEIPGRDAGTPAEQFVVLGAHLDSWDVGTGAQDDGAGVVIVTEAARRIGEMADRPRRTLRVVLYANEEFGLSGARRYAIEHEHELDRHAAAIEADLGAGRAFRFESRVAADDVPQALRIAGLLEPLAIPFTSNDTGGGADIGPLRDRGVPVFQLQQDASGYFEIHHTEADLLERVAPTDLAFNVAAYATVAWGLAEGPDLGHLARRWPPASDSVHPCEWQP
ncbi:MAG TPA: M20/M25/M40 family metallo-hydrolase [Steroidobacteraceae bacterium]|nr:M20/M25/M40 family metallo-hydrolase [Steroidobacteraceae bacterium]